MIEVDQLTKRFGTRRSGPVMAVDDLTFTVRPGHVTGFLGPNGAGKTTTMKIILGLVKQTEGRALVGGQRYDRLVRPLRQVGSLLDATALHGGRTAQAHLMALARSNGIASARVTEVLHLTGMEAVARRRVKGYSLGMKQRLGIAAALLGDPPILMFDEPVNGLDPEGIHWARGFFRQLAAEGRTVLVSSHLMSEMAQTADRLIVIGRGRLIADTPTAELISSSARRDVLVRSPGAAELAGILTAMGADVTPGSGPEPAGTGPAGTGPAGTGPAGTAPAGTGPAGIALSRTELAVTGLDAAAIGDTAAAHGIALHALIPRQASLEDVYLDLTGESTEYRGQGRYTSERTGV